MKWEDRGDEPKEKKYTYVERAYGGDGDTADDDKLNGTDSKAKSELDIATQRLMELIFKYFLYASIYAVPRAKFLSSDNHFNSVLEEIGYNSDKLPLGKLGKATLTKGFEELKELASLIKHPSLAQNKYGKDRAEVGHIFLSPILSILLTSSRSSKNGPTSTILPYPMSLAVINLLL